MSTSDQAPPMIASGAVPPQAKATNYPEPFASRVAGRTKRRLGEVFGLTTFGVNMTTLAPGAISSVHHSHTRQDEFVFVLEGELTLHRGTLAVILRAGDCSGFPAGGEPHHLENRSDAPARYLEVGDRGPDDSASYPDDDLQAAMGPNGWRFTHKDGTPY